MEKRRAHRTIVNLEAELILDGTRYTGMIENYSEEGIYIKVVPTKAPLNLVSETPVELKFQRLPGEPMNQHLHCKIKWYYKTPPHGLTDSIGLEIIDPAVI